MKAFEDFPIALSAIALVVLLGGVATLVLATADGSADRVVLQPEDPQIVALGAGIYTDNCAACHGAALQGEPDWKLPGPDGLLPAPPHDETGHTWHHDSDTLFRVTKYGVAKLIEDPTYQSNMPVYEDVLTDAEINAVLSYIKSTWPQHIRVRHDEMEKLQRGG